MSRLAFVHNLTESDLLFADEWLGGLPCPSMAVVDTDIGLSGFGEITLVMAPDAFNLRRFPAYTSDVYTARIPNAQFEADEEKLNALYEKIVDLLPDAVLKNAKHQLHYRLTEEYNGGLEEVSNNIRYNACAKLAFLRSQGIEVEIPYKQVEAPYAFLNDEKLVTSLKALHPIIWGSEQAREAAKLVSEYNHKRIERSAVSSLIRKNLEKVFYVKPDGALNTASLKPLVFDEMNNFLSIPENGRRVDDYQLMNTVDELFKSRQLDAAFKAWVEAPIQDAFHSPYFLERTKRGDRARHTDFNLYEVTRYLKKQSNNSDSPVFSGAGAVRAELSVAMKSIKAIEAHRHMLTTKEEFEKTKETMNALYASFPEKLAPYYRFDSTSYLYRDDCYDMIKTVARTGSTRVLEEGYELSDIPDDLLGELQAFFDTVKSAKTEYFEINVKDALTFDQFKYAIVPDDLGEEAKRTLARHGLELVIYSPEKGRLAALSETVADCHFGKDIARPLSVAAPEMSL